MSKESFRSSCDLQVSLLELYMCLGFTPTISVDGTEGSDRWSSTDIGATIKKHFKDGFGTITP
jgi:hypothetical protein